MWTKVNIMSNINEPFVNDGGRFEVVFVSMASSRYQLRLSILGLFACYLLWQLIIHVWDVTGA